MRIEDLKMTSLVEYNGNVCSVTGIDLTSVRVSYWLDESKQSSMVSIVNLDNLTPIELTEDWLIELGFKKLDKYTFSKGKWFVYKRRRGFVTGSKRRETTLDYVHELQNWWIGNNKKIIHLS